jgi:transposase-like protein
MEAPKMIANNKDDRFLSAVSIPQIYAAFGAGFLDEEMCRLWVLSSLHENTSVGCPECGSVLIGTGKKNFWDGKRIRCHHCGKFFTALTGTFLSGCHLGYRTIVLLAVFLSVGMKHDEIARKLGISSEAVRLWNLKFQAIDKLTSISGSGGSCM